MEMKNILNKFLQGEITYDNFMCDSFNDAILYFSNKIIEYKFKKFLPFYVECYLYFTNIHKTNSLYIFFYKQLILEFKKMKKIDTFFKKQLNDLNSKILKMNFVYKHILTLYYVFFEEVPSKLSYIFYMYQLVVDSTLDKIYGGRVDDFILENILELTDQKNEYHEKLDFVESLVSKYFKANQNVKFGYELKGVWPMDEHNYPLKFVSNKDGVFIFKDCDGKQISLNEKELDII